MFLKERGMLVCVWAEKPGLNLLECGKVDSRRWRSIDFHRI